MNPAIAYGGGEWNCFTANTRHHRSKKTRMRNALYGLWALEEELGLYE